MIDLYFAPTPNGWKVSIALEEMGLEYRPRLLNLVGGDQFEAKFLAISPNAKMPAIVDHDVEGEPISVFESGAVLLYLAQKTGQFWPTDPRSQVQVIEWLFWQSANQGPMMGQLSHFTNYAPKDQADYGLKRYLGETERALAVMERQLEKQEWLAGGEYSVADMLSFPWVLIAKKLGCDLAPFEAVSAWRGKIKSRPAVQRGVALGNGVPSHGQNASNNNVLFNQGKDHLLKAPR